MKPNGSRFAENHLVVNLTIGKKPAQPHFTQTTKVIAHRELADDSRNRRQNRFTADQEARSHDHGSFGEPRAKH